MMKKNILFLLFFLPLLLNAATFSIKTANKVLESANRYSENNKISLRFLRNKIDDINQQIDLATLCAEKNEKKLETLVKTLDLAKSVKGASSKGKDLIYLTKQSERAQRDLATCRLFQFRAGETLKKYQALVFNVAKSRVWNKANPIWEDLTLKELKNAFNTFPSQQSLKSQFKKLSYTELMSFFIYLVLLWCGYWFFRKKIYQLYLSDYFTLSKEVPFPRRLLFFLWGLLALALFINTFDTATDITIIQNYIVIVTIFVLLRFFLWSLRTFKLAIRFFNWLNWDVYSFNLFNKFITLVFLLNGALTIAVNAFVVEALLVRVLQTGLVIIIFSSLYYYFSLYSKSESTTGFVARNAITFRRMIAFLFALTLVVDLVGYHSLAYFWCKGMVKTIAAAYFLAFSITLLKQLNEYLTGVGAFSRKVRARLGVEKGDIPIELLILDVVLKILVTVIFIVMVVDCWDISGNTKESIITGYMDGINLLSMTVIPSKLVNGLFLFCFLNLLVRYFSHRLSVAERKKELKGESQLNVSIIIMYFGFLVSTILALLTAGVNLTGIAIVAGALSVGIGLGLKSIINNFVSGLILIFERPIKAGDRIRVNDFEGIVTKVRARATEIRTRDRSEVIIPNEEMITQPVTNFMLRESLWRIKCYVGVAYGSDVQLVKKILLEIANHQQGVVQEEPNKPNVLFSSFGDSSLDFVLRCVITDVNRKNFIISDINFAIEEQFRKHGIEIPFPQRDINIKTDKGD